MTRHEGTPAARLSISQDQPSSWSDGFAQDVRLGLSARPKYLPARHLYDAIGSALYEAITLLPEYYLTRAESDILDRHAEAILEHLGEVEIVELGPGNGRKSRIVLEAALRRQPRVHYRPIDISAASLRALADQLIVEYDRLFVSAYCGDYRRALNARSLRGDARMLVMFLGSSIGNYERHEATALLRTIAAALQPGDAVLLGADLRKPEEELVLAYDDPAGVTAAFNRNVLARINRELGGAFDLRKFCFAVRYDDVRGCVDSFQESVVAQRVPVTALSLDVEFAKGERILTESSYKYAMDDIREIAQASGLRPAASWTDARSRFSVNLLTLANCRGFRA